MSNIIPRRAQFEVERYLKIFPAIVVLGSRQCGKSTLIRLMSVDIEDYLYLDLEKQSDRAKLTDAELFFSYNANKTICLDEVQTMPEIFTILRSVIDEDRRNGRFILLGSASRELIQQSSDSLAGRIGLIDLTPFLINEVEPEEGYSLFKYWYRGGYPDSYLAADDESSRIWCENYIRTYIERDIPLLGFGLAAPRMMRLLMMLAHEHGGMLNLAKLAAAMNVTAPTIHHYIDILEQTYVVRVLPSYQRNLRKRLTKTPKVYLRDCGLLHQLLDIRDYNDLLGNIAIGTSWEGLVIENVAAVVKNAPLSFYRSATGGEEMDLVVEMNDKLIAIECKCSSSPSVTPGFWKSIETLKPYKTYVVAPVTEGYYLREDVKVVNCIELIQDILAI